MDNCRCSMLLIAVILLYRFCYECINKATGIKACIVCGKSNGKILACEKCVKAFHAECLAKDGMSAQGLPPVTPAKSGKVSSKSSRLLLIIELD